MSRIRTRFDEPMVARDGTRLSVDMYLPAAEGRYPVLITRTPYDNNRTARAGGGLPAPADRFKTLAAHGFVVLACDVRGRGDSDGRFVPFAHEAADGADTVDWARGLPESDGRVGLFGSGYAGFAALAAAIDARVDAVAVGSPFGVDGTPYRGGALRLDWLFWMHLVGGRANQPVDVPAWPGIFRHRPLLSLPDALGRDDIPWVDWLTGDIPGLDLASRLGSVGAPCLFVTGWWDAASTTTVRYWERAGRDGGHALVVGPWDPRAVRDPRADTGGVRWGPRAMLDPDELLLDWFTAHLRGEGTPARGARVFVTGRNEWTSLDFAGDHTPLWLHSAGRANTRRGDGRLVAAARDGSAPDRFTHDPDDPVPWQPGGPSFSRSAPGITLDTAFVTTRDDVLAYAADPVSRPTLIRGFPVARLWVDGDAPDADWVVAIEDVSPGDGRAVHLAHGIARTRAVAAGTGPVELVIELTPIAHELRPGHRLRLLVASSLWPLYAVNLGGADYLRDTEARASEHALFHDTRFPSRLELPGFDDGRSGAS